jgi:hypothetical protein
MSYLTTEMHADLPLRIHCCGNTLDPLLLSKVSTHERAGHLEVELRFYCESCYKPVVLTLAPDNKGGYLLDKLPEVPKDAE